MIKFLQGKKTFICSAVIFVAGGLLALHVISQEVFNVIVGIAGGAGLAALRSAINE